MLLLPILFATGAINEGTLKTTHVVGHRHLVRGHADLVETRNPA